MLQESYDDFHKKDVFLCFHFLIRSVSLLKPVTLGVLIVIDYIELNEIRAGAAPLSPGDCRTTLPEK